MEKPMLLVAAGAAEKSGSLMSLVMGRGGANNPAILLHWALRRSHRNLAGPGKADYFVPGQAFRHAINIGG